MTVSSLDQTDTFFNYECDNLVATDLVKFGKKIHFIFHALRYIFSDILFHVVLNSVLCKYMKEFGKTKTKKIDLM